MLRLGVGIKDEEQMLHTAERLAGMSRGEIQHIFDDVDMDGNGSIDIAEMDILGSYFGDMLDVKTIQKMFEDMDSDKDGRIDADEFFRWMVLHTSNVGTIDENGTKALKRRAQRLELSQHELDQKLADLLEELGIGAVVQKVTHPLHSAFGRSLYDHFVSCHVLAREWGNSETVCKAALFHAVYQRGDGMRAIDYKEYRPYLQEKLGKDVEELIYLFPSSHKSALLENGLLMADVGSTIVVPNVLEGGNVTIPECLRPALVELEVINSHDQHILENCDPIHNLWLFYQHVTAMPIMSEGARKTILEYMKRAPGAKVKDVVDWHERRFKDKGNEIPGVWKHHIDLFRPEGKFACAENELKAMADKNGDGVIDWEEFTGFDWDSCHI